MSANINPTNVLVGNGRRGISAQLHEFTVFLDLDGGHFVQMTCVLDCYDCKRQSKYVDERFPYVRRIHFMCTQCREELVIELPEEPGLHMMIQPVPK